MNINDFQYYINKTILDRGYNYYMVGNIIDVNEQGKNYFIFIVEGSEDYEVVVKLDDNGEVLYSACACPYDFGPVCKHEAAAYFKLAERLKNPNNDQSFKRPNLHEILINLSKDELVNIIEDLTFNDPALKNSLIVRYAKVDYPHELQNCKKLIDSIVRKYTREGYIRYNKTSAFVSEMEEVLEKVRNTENIVLAVDIALLLLEEAIKAFQYADDSDGDIGSLVTDSIKTIEEAVTDRTGWDIQESKMVFVKLLDCVDSGIFSGWEEFRNDLLGICVEFADDQELRDKFKTKINSLMDLEASDSYQRYNNESLLQILFSLIEKYGEPEEAEQFIKDHLQFKSFRERLIEIYRQEGDFQKVIEVAEEGEKQDKQYPGLVTSWKKFRYEAYKELSRKEEQEKLAKELLLVGDFDYYVELRELADGNQTEFYTNIKQELKNGNGWSAKRMYLELIDKENDIDEMMDFVRNNPSNIESYAERLVDRFRDEVIEIYKEHIKVEGKHSSNRRAYQNICKKLKKYKAIAGKENQADLVKELMHLYKKRPAFLDELGKIR
ncbi:SWIM zinc finger domain-containing protein [Neobacillus niacini]|uniref:SWIM zinc finger family protein n=1 Tax=Neobacillus niacini TaxID=86668 RepID=UPI0021CB956C|nr:hypothetical protein [Neobacillus niacini]MCM3764956.1 hypothetical protein [Neobacillus niacini]